MNSLRKLKIVLLGESNVGKSSLIGRFIYDSFEDAYVTTTGIDFLSKTIYVDSRTIRCQVWDTAGSEKFKCLIPNYIRDCGIAVVVYDITNRNSFNETTKWIEYAREIRGKNLSVFLVGNKIDLALDQQDAIKNRKVTFLDGDSQAKFFGCKFFETSAKTAFNVVNLFRTIALSSLTNENGTAIDENHSNIVEVQLDKLETHEESSYYSKCCSIN